MALRDWHVGRVVAVSLLWIFGVLIVFLAWGAEVASHRQVPLGSGLSYGTVTLPGGFWTLLGPPVLLAVAWLAVRRSRPAS